MGGSMHNKKALLIGYEAVFFFDKEKFCSDFSLNAKCGEKLSATIKKILFESNFHEHCNTGTVQFEWLFDCAFTAVKALRKNRVETQREELYCIFEKIWNECLFKDERMIHIILNRVKTPIAMIAITNPIHCKKIKASHLEKYCQASFLYSPTHAEECDLGIVIQKLADEINIRPEQFVYMGEDFSSSDAIQKNGIKTINCRTPLHDLHQELARNGLI